LRGLIMYAQRRPSSMTMTPHMKMLLLDAMGRRGLTARMRSYERNWMDFAMAEPNVLIGNVFGRALREGLEIMDR
jgi:hypothetical protein